MINAFPKEMYENSEGLDETVKAKDEDFSIDIANCITFGINEEHFRLSNTNKQFNEQAYKAIKTYNPTFSVFQIPVGYRICNLSAKPIENILVPEYHYNPNSGYWEGKEVVKSLNFNEFLVLPTKYLIYLLMTHNPKGLKVNNGEFRQLYNDSLIDETDVKVSNFYFVAEQYWESFTKGSAFHEAIGYHHINQVDGIYLGFTIKDEEYKKTFGYLLNPINDSHTDKFINDEEIDINSISDSIKFLATVIWKKEIR